MRPLRSVFDTISSSSPRRFSTPVGRIARVIVDESSRRANAPHEWSSHPPKGLRRKMLIRCDRGNPRDHVTAPYHYLGASLAVQGYRRRATRGLHRRAQHPGRELGAAEIKTLALGRLARRGLEDEIENALAALLDALLAFED